MLIKVLIYCLACYLIVSIVYITGYFNGNDVACTSNNPYEDPNDRLFSNHPTLIVVQVRVMKITDF